MPDTSGWPFAEEAVPGDVEDQKEAGGLWGEETPEELGWPFTGEEPAGKESQPAGEPELTSGETQPAAAEESQPAGEEAQLPAGEGIGAHGSQARLFDYLIGLTEALPSEKKEEFLQSDVRLKMESIKSRLQGRSGLHKDFARFRPRDKKNQAVEVTTRRLADTLRYIQKMSAAHPDTFLGAALGKRLEHIVARIQELKKRE